MRNQKLIEAAIERNNIRGLGLHAVIETAPKEKRESLRSP